MKRSIKGRTFGGAAACPHCSSPIRVFITIVRTQCVLDVVAYSYLVPPYVPLPDDADDVSDFRGGGTGAATATVTSGSPTTAAGRDGVKTPGASSGIIADADPVPRDEQIRMWDDDEAPFPT